MFVKLLAFQGDCWTEVERATECEYKLLYSIKNFLSRLCADNSRQSEISEYIGFEVFVVVSLKMAVFWAVVPYSLVEVYRYFRGPCCLHDQP
jgi:hypothetical protein